MFTDILTELTSGVAEKQLQKMKDSDPEEYEKTLKMFIQAVEVGIHFLEESPELRKGFARIHSKFLEYPEARATMQKAIESYEKLNLNK